MASRTRPQPDAPRSPAEALLLVPHRDDATSEADLPGEYQRLLALVTGADGPVRVKDIGALLGLDTKTQGKLEPLRGKLSKLAGRGWLRKLPDGRFTACL